VDPSVVSPWSADWAWSLPLIFVTVAIHSLGLGPLTAAFLFAVIQRLWPDTRKRRLID
jgi:hypothetical protein